MEIIKNASLRRAMQISLLNCVTPSLRQVSVTCYCQKVILNFYYDYIQEGEEELADEIETEMWGLFYKKAEIEKNIFIIPFPNPIPIEGLPVYCRLGEKNLLFLEQCSRLDDDDSDENLLISQAAQISLLGHVSTNLRKILLKVDDPQLILHFYYDRITEEEKELPTLIGEKMKFLLANKQVIISISVLPFPQLVPEGSAIYARFERHTN